MSRFSSQYRLSYAALLLLLLFLLCCCPVTVVVAVAVVLAALVAVVVAVVVVIVVVEVRAICRRDGSLWRSGVRRACSSARFRSHGETSEAHGLV